MSTATPTGRFRPVRGRTMAGPWGELDCAAWLELGAPLVAVTVAVTVVPVAEASVPAPGGVVPMPLQAASVAPTATIATAVATRFNRRALRAESMTEPYAVRQLSGRRSPEFTGL